MIILSAVFRVAIDIAVTRVMCHYNAMMSIVRLTPSFLMSVTSALSRCSRERFCHFSHEYSYAATGVVVSLQLL